MRHLRHRRRRSFESSFWPDRQSASNQCDELLNGKAGIGDDAAERTGPDLLATEHYMAASLAPKHEPNALQSGADIPP